MSFLLSTAVCSNGAISQSNNFYIEQNAIYHKSLAAFSGLGGAFEINNQPSP